MDKNLQWIPNGNDQRANSLKCLKSVASLEMPIEKEDTAKEQFKA